MERRAPRRRLVESEPRVRPRGVAGGAARARRAHFNMHLSRQTEREEEIEEERRRDDERGEERRGEENADRGYGNYIRRPPRTDPGAGVMRYTSVLWAPFHFTITSITTSRSRSRLQVIPTRSRTQCTLPDRTCYPGGREGTEWDGMGAARPEPGGARTDPAKARDRPTASERRGTKWRVTKVVKS